MEGSEVVESVALSVRLKTAIRVGALVGAVLGLVSFVAAYVFWAEDTPADGTVLLAGVTGLVAGTALVSVAFGGVVAGVSRAAATRAHPGTRLRSSPVVTVLAGAGMGLVLGVIAGDFLASVVGDPAEGGGSLTQLPVLETFIVTLLGGAVLGSFTAAATQAFALPVVVDQGSEREIEQIRTRLLDAVRIPVSALLLLVMLVLPFGWTLIQSTHLSTVVAPIVAILMAGGILTFGALSESRPDMRITIGEFGVALAGVFVIVGAVLALVFAEGPTGEEPHGPGGTVNVVATVDIAFDETEWSVPEGEVTFVYESEVDLVHTLTIEGMEDELDLRVESKGDVDSGTVILSPGTYTVYCTIRGHREQGMEGQLTVMASQDEPPPTSSQPSG
jgi:plastocyanin